jgi:hypothetical protein
MRPKRYLDRGDCGFGSLRIKLGFALSANPRVMFGTEVIVAFAKRV